jgi:hypothetical protein
MSTERPGEERPVDEAVDQAWRDASTEGPSHAIDAAIREAARAESCTQAGGQGRTELTWTPRLVDSLATARGRRNGGRPRVRPGADDATRR